MDNNVLFKNIQVVNEGKIFNSDVLVINGVIQKIDSSISVPYNILEINGEGVHLLPGAIDDQVHFREPGLTHKANIHSESGAAVAGGTTSFMEMPNTIPQALTQKLLEEKYEIGKRSSYTNYSFFMGASNHNLEEVLKTNPKNVCGIKVFMGSSTGDMLVDNMEILEKIFCRSNQLVATHCEYEPIIRANSEKARDEFGENVPPYMHPIIRNREACIKSSSMAIEIANKCNARLHVLHITTQEEARMLKSVLPLEQKNITMEACVHHLWFDDSDYQRLGNLIKCNPAIKTREDKDAVWDALVNGSIDIVATDHAPHTWEEKQNPYFSAPSGLPLIQHSLLMMFNKCLEKGQDLSFLVEKMAHNPAKCFKIQKRGFIKEGFQADLVVFDENQSTKISKSGLLYKCGWSPLENLTLRGKILQTFVNGMLTFDGKNLHFNNGGERLIFNF